MASHSEFWSGSTYSLLTDKPSAYKRINKLLRANTMRKAAELLDTLIGAASGTASKTYKRVSAPSDGDVGGVRTIDTVTVISSSVGATEIAALKADIVNNINAPATYPADASGNGGAAYTTP